MPGELPSLGLQVRACLKPIVFLIVFCFLSPVSVNSMVLGTFAIYNLKQIETQRLIIRQINSSDEERFVELQTNKAVQTNEDIEPVGELQIRDRFKQLLQSMAGLEQGHDFNEVKAFGFAILDKTSGAVIGFATFDRAWFVNYFYTTTILEPANWNQGFGTEARLEINKFIFRSSRVPGLISLISPLNRISMRVTEKIGFKLIEKIRGRNYQGNVVDWHEYRMANPEMGLSSSQFASVQPRMKFTNDTLLRIRDLKKSSMDYKDAINGIYQILINDKRLMRENSPEFLSFFLEKVDFSSEVDFEVAASETLEEMQYLSLTETQRCQKALR